MFLEDGSRGYEYTQQALVLLLHLLGDTEWGHRVGSLLFHRLDTTPLSCGCTGSVWNLIAICETFLPVVAWLVTFLLLWNFFSGLQIFFYY